MPSILYNMYCCTTELHTGIAVTALWCAGARKPAKGGLSCKNCLPPHLHIYNHMQLPHVQPHIYHHHHHHHTVQVAICSSGILGKRSPAQVAGGQGDRAPASIGARWSGMQQQHACNLHMGTYMHRSCAHVQVRSHMIEDRRRAILIFSGSCMHGDLINTNIQGKLYANTNASVHYCS